MPRPKQRALVTGGAGFVGSHVCDAFVRKQISVVCVDNFATGTAANVSHLRECSDFRLVEHDVVEPLDLPGEFDFVLHLASAASPRDYFRLPIETMQVGAIGTMNALNFASRNSARFLLASTSEVYGDPQEHPQRETYWGNVNPVGPRSVYDEAKRYAEALTSAYRREGRCATAIARIFNTYGPRMRADDGRMIPTFIRQAMAGESLTVTGTGQQTRSVCYVDDTVRGLLALLSSTHPGPVNIGNPHEMTVRQLAEEIRDRTSSTSGIRRVDAAEDDPQRRCPDISLAASALGWQPEITLSTGLDRTISWFSTEASAVTPA